MTKIKNVGILGAGKVGIVLAQLALKAGYHVRISGSGSVEKIAMTIETLVPGATPATNQGVVAKSDLIILAIPLSRYKNIKSKLLKGKLVIDAMNYWWETDGIREEVLDPSSTSSEQVQKYFNKSTVVKTFNHMGYHNLQEEAKPAGAENRKALFVTGDSKEAVDEVAEFVDTMGFDTVVHYDIADGIMTEPGSELFGASLTKADLQNVIDHFDETDFGKKIKAEEQG
ncbi:NAD(P)-binding domain-containing protein [Lentilactobacillus otakiensis]|jgi:predicted dinucleotide-binding enzyme|uniref:Coenzyme F420-dependent NADP oxidoreductase n=1 Tax=Lentilactobacillus otakiensis DSM 19908 = JCM 15040 TaxID=1423780 RepID=S4NIA8_9LACO|nr:NAD(P)-binding domain-containing protein [Lentilactobacillus otakiensis]KRL11439.1 coenzyme F420-dependent NADP oxidoreductase [Lentilactobacillus otakiensis DSM 19908 = JCM 15040]MBZ3776938.1 NAD(P)-binding domain-containing protein [Lentilactobacillus otakiensis]MDV3517857.1 NAD(P)-binding domain-containing protein [Lentilactobacillus otakiensis]GAD16967.1 coenzyme F420-dependent NADP oxidoreductase [Lentilactobacillus otakiensis DSM 19908 = JCM 15040]